MTGNLEGTGCDHAYEHDMRVEYARGAADALRAVKDYFRHVNNLDAQDAVAAAAVEVANEFGVAL
jgi:hypothetical protein